MYMPFVRGKQFELLAIREMADHLAESGNIRPIIEPVRNRVDGLNRCLDELARARVATTVVVNPTVGEMAGSRFPNSGILELIADRPADLVRVGVIVNALTDVEDTRQMLNASELDNRPVDLVHAEFAGERGLTNLVTEASYQLVEQQAQIRRLRLPGQPIKWTDPFPWRRTNLEYVDSEPSLFTDDNVYFATDQFAGFADYLTIGGGWSEGGSSPRAVVIHLTYQDATDRSIWIRHFCSQSNSDTADTAGKFGEAVRSLVEWADANKLSNPALESFRRYATQEAYPGLGMIKKLSIQNHLYVVAEALRVQ